MTVALFGGTDLVVLEGAEVDGRIGEFHTFQAQASNFTIESGALSTDHIIEQPDTLAISWIVSNLDEQGASFGHRAANVLDGLRARIKDRKVYQVVTRHRLYPSMALTSVTSEHVSPLTGGLRGRLMFQAVNTDLLERVKVPAAKVAKKGAATKVEAGRVQPVADPATPSLAKQILQGITKATGAQ